LRYRIREFDGGNDCARAIANIDAPVEAKSPPLSYVIGDQLADRQTGLRLSQTYGFVDAAVWIFEATVACNDIEKVQRHDTSIGGVTLFPTLS
jgi:hypothetical protein